MNNIILVSEPNYVLSQGLVLALSRVEVNGLKYKPFQPKLSIRIDSYDLKDNRVYDNLEMLDKDIINYKLDDLLSDISSEYQIVLTAQLPVLANLVRYIYHRHSSGYVSKVFIVLHHKFDTECGYGLAWKKVYNKELEGFNGILKIVSNDNFLSIQINSISKVLPHACHRDEFREWYCVTLEVA